MQKQHYRKAVDQLDDMRSAYKELITATSTREGRRAWGRLLEAMTRIYNKLAAASNGDYRARAWSDEAQNRRRSDPLLQYMHQARNASHTIGDTEAGGGPVVINMAGEPQNIAGLSWTLDWDADGLDVQYTLPPGVRAGDYLVLNTVRPLPVTNRGVTFPVPKEHLGEPIPPYCSEFGRLAVQYMEELIKEAEQFVDD